MNNEFMARAVTELDDGLIAGAHTFSKKSSFSRPAARLLAAAACITVVFCAVFASLLENRLICKNMRGLFEIICESLTNKLVFYFIL